MALPGVTQRVLDTASGALALGSDLHVKIGVSSSGTADSFAIYTDPDQLETDYGTGPLVEAAAYHIQNTGLPVAVVRCASAEVTAGTLGAITKVGGHSGPTISDNSTAANDAYELLVEIVLGGAVATATFKYSLDGGDSWSATVVTAATVSLTGTGISLAFATGTYVAGDQYSAEASAPEMSSTGLANAIDAAINATSAFRMIHIVGYTDDPADTATVAAAVQSLLAGAATNDYVYTYAILDGADDVDADLVSAVASVATNRVGVVGGFVEMISPLTQRYYRRPAAWVAVAEIMRRTLAQDPGYFAPFGPVLGVTSIERDEFTTPLLDDARYMTLRTYKGRQGFYVTRGRLMATTGSDFENLCNRQVMDAACAVSYDALLNFVNKDLQVNRTTGLLEETEAQAIEAFVNGKLRAAVTSPGHASDVAFVIDRTQDVLTTATLKGKTRILPKAYARFIENDLSFRNPALEAAVAA